MENIPFVFGRITIQYMENPDEKDHFAKLARFYTRLREYFNLIYFVISNHFQMRYKQFWFIYDYRRKGTYVPTKIMINEQPIQQVSHFNFLGFDVGYSWNNDSRISYTNIK